jgi:hypothetical protein
VARKTARKVSRSRARKTLSIVDPRRGDIEDDASSTKRRSMLSLFGSMLVEISFPKLILAWTLLLVVPGLLLGLAPIVFIEWLTLVTDKLASLAIGFWSLVLLAVLIGAAWFGWRSVLRLVEKSFWTLNSIVVEPGYVAFREAFRQLAERLFARHASDAQRARLRAASAAIAGILVCGLAGLVLRLVWPQTHLFGSLSEIDSWKEVAMVALANSVAVITAYLGAAALIWGFADASMAQPRNLGKFDRVPNQGRTWRIAHLSDIHVVGERYGRRIESGRSGPSGNERLKRLLNQLEVIDAKRKLDAIVITGDMTDAGISTEWAELLEMLAAHSSFDGRVLMLPGNHDLNIVDRANPARMDLPTSPNRPLRQIRCLSAMNAVQGRQVRVIDRDKDRVGVTLEEALRPHKSVLERFADVARPILSTEIPELWAQVFPMVVPPRKKDGLGIILLNSNADTHFSFTNALGMVSAEQMRGVEIAAAEYPEACWIVALHHHVVEYPWAANALSERIGTALINGNWFVRSLRPLLGRAILMHGHRHIDWIGHIAGLAIVSAPSPVMEVTDDKPTHFYIHTLAIDGDGKLKLLKPDRVVIAGEPVG